MNNYFATVGHNTALSVRDNIPSTPTEYMCYTPESHSHFKFHPITTRQLKELVRSLPENSPGEDGISATLLKLALPCQTLTLIVIVL